MVESRLDWVRTVRERRTGRRLVAVIRVRDDGDLHQGLEVVHAGEIYGSSIQLVMRITWRVTQ